jgi:hypothetical protein
MSSIGFIELTGPQKDCVCTGSELMASRAWQAVLQRTAFVGIARAHAIEISATIGKGCVCTDFELSAKLCVSSV